MRLPIVYIWLKKCCHCHVALYRGAVTCATYPLGFLNVSHCALIAALGRALSSSLAFCSRMQDLSVHSSAHACLYPIPLLGLHGSVPHSAPRLRTRELLAGCAETAMSLCSFGFPAGVSRPAGIGRLKKNFCSK